MHPLYSAHRFYHPLRVSTKPEIPLHSVTAVLKMRVRLTDDYAGLGGLIVFPLLLFLPRLVLMATVIVFQWTEFRR